MINIPLGQRLEQYTSKHPQEVLIVHTQIDGELDQIVIYKGYSSSLIRATAFDPDVPVLPADAEIISIDRVASPFHPDNPQYIQQDLTLATMESLLHQLGI